MKLHILFLCVTSAIGRRGLGPTEQEWGFVTVREGAHMFWWLHQTAAKVAHFSERPLIIWLQGGPGASSTGFGNFAEIGPLDENLNLRSTTWLNNYNVLFVDNPVGSGFSYVDSKKYLTRSNKEIAGDFLVLLQGFYKAVPELQETPLYIFSESYGGKMTAEIALVLHEAIKDGRLNIKLKGVGLGDAWISPIDCVLTWAPYLFHLGAIDQHGYEQIDKMAQKTKKAYDNDEFVKSTQLWYKTESVISQVTSNIDFYNVLLRIPSSFKSRTAVIKPAIRSVIDDKITILMNHDVREALNLNVTWGGSSETVFKALESDFMKPVTDIVEQLLNSTDLKVAVYNGQLDLIVDTPGTIKWVDELKFKGSNSWKMESRRPILADGHIEGYYKKLGNLAMYWVNRAGHMVPSDNPTAMDFILEDIMQD